MPTGDPVRQDQSDTRAVSPDDEIRRLRETVAHLESSLEEASRAAQRLAVRDAAVRAISESSSLAQSAPETLRAICETLDWQLGLLWVVEPDLSLLRFSAIWFAPSSPLPEFETYIRQFRFARGIGIPGRLWEARQPLWIPDVALDPDPLLPWPGVCAAVGVPVVIAGDVLAVMLFFSPEIRQPDKELLQMLSALGNNLGQLVARRRAQETLDRFFTLSIDMLAIAGFDGYYKRLNPAWEKTLGYSVEELSAVPFLEFVHPEDRESTLHEVAKLSAGEPTISFENRYRAKDGSYHWLLWNAAPFSQRQVIYASARDITERKRAEENILRLRREAEAANRAKSEFLARMSHEIRTPLNVVIGMGDLLERTSLTQDQRQYVKVFQRAGGNLLALINDILDLAKVESGRIVLEETDFEPAQVVDGVLEIMALRAKDKDIELSARIDPAVPARLRGDPDRLRQILINLVNNAVKFTSKGYVRIAVQPDPSDPSLLRFSVADTGIGIAPEHHAAVFEAFTQGDASTTRKYGGTGLGLAICKRLVELMGGAIWFQSILGAGTTFYFTAAFASPGASPSPAPERSLETTQALPRPISGLRILVADDSEENRFLVAEYLKDLGCHLQFANDGRAAVDKFCAGSFDLVLMDLQMPELDGYSATTQIRQWESANHRSPVPVIALTASALEAELDRALHAGCTAWLRKPVRLATLLETVGKFAGTVPTPSPARIQVRVNRKIRAVIPAYLDARRQDIRTILSALESGAFPKIAELGHKMAGSGGGYGFNRISEIGAALERAAKDQNPNAIRSHTAELATYLDQVEII